MIKLIAIVEQLPILRVAVTNDAIHIQYSVVTSALYYSTGSLFIEKLKRGIYPKSVAKLSIKIRLNLFHGLF